MARVRAPAAIGSFLCGLRPEACSLATVRWFLDTQLYSYLANGTIPAAQWETLLGGRELWLSPITVYELVEGLLNASPHTYPLSEAAITEAARIPDQRVLSFPGLPAAVLRKWLDLVARGESPDGRDFRRFRGSIDAGRARFLAALRRHMAAVMPNYRRAGDPLFSAQWQTTAGRAPGENLDAAFVFHTAVLERTMRIRYNPEKHPSDYLDYLQLGFLNQEGLSFMTADRNLVRLTLRSLQSERIYHWAELITPRSHKELCW